MKGLKRFEKRDRQNRAGKVEQQAGNRPGRAAGFSYGRRGGELLTILWRWQQALSHLQQTTGKVIQTLTSVMEDTKVSPSARVSAARSVLEFAFRGVEMLETEQRIAALEATLTPQEGKL